LHLWDKNHNDMVGTIIGAIGGIASGIYGASQARDAAEEQRRELARQKAANEAWYNRNYYQDYMNTVEAQNALKRYRKAWEDQVNQARARQAVTGGTPEQAQAVAEAGGEAMGNMMGTLAAKGQQNKQAIDTQKLAMDINLSNQQAALAEANQQAGMNLAMNGMNVAATALSGYEGTDKVETPIKTAEETAPGMKTAVAKGRETRTNPTSYTTPIVTPERELTQEEKNWKGLIERGYYR
jgi:hypothetical protein